MSTALRILPGVFCRATSPVASAGPLSQYGSMPRPGFVSCLGKRYISPSPNWCTTTHITHRPSPVCASAVKRPARPAEDAGEGSAIGKDGSDAARLGTASTPGEPRVNVALMQAMGDYFGDDGREVDDYSKRPRNEAGKVMLRVLLVGSSEEEVATAKVLSESKRVRGLYYCADEGGSCSLEMEQFGHSSTVAADGPQVEADIIKFCKWAFVDAVFVGPSREGAVGADTEAELAAAGVTLFSHDIAGALAAGSMSVDDCFATISEELDTVAPPAEQLVE